MKLFGQSFFFDLANHKPGSGKSFLMNSLINQYLKEKGMSKVKDKSQTPSTRSDKG